MNLRYEVLLEEFQVDINLRLAVALHLLVFVSYGFLGEPLDRLLKNRMQDLLKHLPRVCDLVHDLAEHLKTQVHVQNYLGVESENLVLLNHLGIHALVEHPLLRLGLDVFDGVLKSRIFIETLQSIMVSNQEGILVSPVQLALILVIEFDLSLYLLQLLPLVVINLLQE